MRYLSWATFYEGESDALYLDIIIPRAIRDIIARCGSDLVEVADNPAVRLGGQGRAVDAVSDEACSFKGAFDIVFIHADTGGRGLQENLHNRSKEYCEAMQQKCDWPSPLCVTVTPKHETEAWLLCDASAVAGAFGYTGNPIQIGLPASAHAAESLIDPKATLVQFANAITGRRRARNIDTTFPAIAQRQDLSILRGATSYRAFEERLINALKHCRLVG